VTVANARITEIINMASTAAAKAKYGHKVCKNFLGMGSTAGCDKAFDQLVTNMKAGYEALAK